MTPRQLTAEEEVVLDAIIAQRCESWNDCFEYDYIKAQKYFAKIGIFSKYSMTPEKQCETILKLADDHIVEVDCLVNVKMFNEQRAIYEPWEPPLESEYAILFDNHALPYERLRLSKIIGIGGDCKECRSSLYIYMPLESFNEINDKYRASHKVQLGLDTKCHCLKLKIDQEEWRWFPPLDDKKLPYKILAYAYNHPNRMLTRTRLYAKANIDVRNKYLKSQVFSDNRRVQALHPRLLRLDKNSIAFIKTAKLTLAELNELKTALKIK